MKRIIELIEGIQTASDSISHENRRSVVADSIRPLIVLLKTEKRHFNVDSEKFDILISGIEISATQVWKRADGHVSAGKIRSEAQKLVGYLNK